MLFLVTSSSPSYCKHKKRKITDWDEKFTENRNEIKNQTKTILIIRGIRPWNYLHWKKTPATNKYSTCLVSRLLCPPKQWENIPSPSTQQWPGEVWNNVRVLAMPPPSFCKKLTLSWPKPGQCLKFFHQIKVFPLWAHSSLPPKKTRTK